MPPETETQQTETEGFQSSDSFRATMAKVIEGEQNSAVLQQTAVGAMRGSTTADPIPDRTVEIEGKGDLREEGEQEDQKQDESLTEELDPNAARKPIKEEPEDESDENEESEENKSRDSLRKSLTKETKVPEEKGEEEEDEILRGELPSDPSRVRKRIKHYEGLLSDRERVLATTKKELETLQTKVKSLEEKTGGLPEDVADQLSELRQYRRRYAIEKDPEFQERYAAKFEESNDLVDDALKSIGISAGTRDAIKQAGGISSFMRSDALVSVKGGAKIDAREFVRLALGKMHEKAPDAEAVVQSEMAAQRRLEAEKTKFIEKETAEADKYFASMTEKQAGAAEYEEKIEEQLNEVVSNFKATVHTSDWMKDLEVPNDANADTRKTIISNNKFRAKLRNLFDMQVDMPVIREAAKRATTQAEVDELANVLIDSARVFHVERELKAEKKRAEDLQKELDKVRKVSGRSTPRNTTGGRVPANTTGEPKRSDFESDFQFTIALNRWKTANGIKVEV